WRGGNARRHPAGISGVARLCAHAGIKSETFLQHCRNRFRGSRFRKNANAHAESVASGTSANRADRAKSRRAPRLVVLVPPLKTKRGACGTRRVYLVKIVV